MSENGGHYLAVVRPYGDVMHSLFPWFVYSNLLLNSSSFLNPAPCYVTQLFRTRAHMCTCHVQGPTPQVMPLVQRELDEGLLLFALD